VVLTAFIRGPREGYSTGAMPTNETHDPNLKSWVESANDPTTDFPIQNLALCSFERSHDGHTHDHMGVRIGDQVLDVSMLNEAGYFDDGDEYVRVCLGIPYWGAIADTPSTWGKLRRTIQNFLRADTHVGQQGRRLRQKALTPASDLKFTLPISTFNYTDFYASKHHAFNVGSMFRPDNPLLPNYKHVPIGYHGRSSSIVVSGTEVRRPNGQLSPPDADPGAGPSFGPCKMLDYELELALVVGRRNHLGVPIPMAGVSEHMFGVLILNDWSARDMQKWEYQPLGPFLAKNFATSVSPYIVTMEALEPFRIPGPEREPGDPEPLPYLRSTENWGLDLTCEVWLQSLQMREKNTPPVMLSRGSFRHMYWTLAQLLVHHTSNGCNMMPGDLLGSGTISGPDKSSRGCLLELTWEGNGPDGKPRPRSPFQLPTGESRTFLADGDEIVIKAYGQRDGFRRIGFGECRGRILPAP
jgi:fumarylacetoacetase